MSDLPSTERFNRLPEIYRRRAQEIAARVTQIDALLPPCEPDAIRDAVIRLRAQLRPQPDTETGDMLSEFKVACRDLPEWALSEATSDFLAGRVENHTGQFMPTCAEFAKHARTVLLPFLAERAALRVEASKLVERAEDQARRDRIAIERQDPAVRARVKALVGEVAAFVPKALPSPHGSASAEDKKRLEALRKPRAFQSKLGETRIVREAEQAKKSQG